MFNQSEYLYFKDLSFLYGKNFKILSSIFWTMQFAIVAYSHYYTMETPEPFPS